MKTLKQVEDLLVELDHCVADDLETQDLDFKKWDADNLKSSLDLVVDVAICMANGGSGTVVFGVADKVQGRAKAILGVPRIA